MAKNYIQQKSFNHHFMCDADFYNSKINDLLHNPEIAFRDQNRKMLKDGDSTTVIKYAIDKSCLVIKRYNRTNILNKFRKSFTTTRAEKCWHSAKNLITLGIHTAKPVAYVERRFGPLRGKSYFISEYVDGINALEYFKNLTVLDNRDKKIATQIISLIQTLKAHNISHGDMKATNIIIRDEQPTLIDLDGMCIHQDQRSFQRAHQRDILRFMKNWKDDSVSNELFTRLLITSSH